MQLTALRARLGAAACLLVAAGARTAGAQSPDSTFAPDPTWNTDSTRAPQATEAAAPPRWQFDGAGLLYGEKGRAKVIEPQARITRLFADGGTLSATLGLDVITGASPTGAIPTTSVQTTTTPSGNVQTSTANEVPTHPFNDNRAGLDLEWSRPFGWLTPSLGTHASIEKDYRSLGGTAKLSVAMMRKLTTVTVGAGYNEDRVNPTGGTRAPLTDGTFLISTAANPKRVRSALAGVSRVLTRRWLFGVTGTWSTERGYLTDPYKVISVLDATGAPTGALLTDSRPTSRTRHDLLASSVYHLTQNILYASYRYYWDDWGVTSHTADTRYRVPLSNQSYIQPHVRYYFQTRANFFQFGLTEGAPLPAFATSDARLADLRTLTLGTTYGFHPGGGPGELSFRAEYLRQWGKGSGGQEGGEFEGEGDPTASSGPVRFIPPENIGSVTIGYSVPF